MGALRTRAGGACAGLYVGLRLGAAGDPLQTRAESEGCALLRRRGGRCAMPGMVLFGRRWSLASDDLVFPGSFELFLRVLW